MPTRLEARRTGPLLSEDGLALEMRAVVRRYPAAAGAARPGAPTPVTALEGLDLAVREGEVLAVIGPSGCGKSTLLELAAGLQEPDEGTVAAFGGVSAPERLGACAHMPQRDLLLPWRDALANAALALECGGLSRREARSRAAPLLERFGLGQFAGARPAALSGGMRQRVAFLRTLLAGRPVLLLDEPFASLDSISRASMQEWLAGVLLTEGRTLVLVTHDVDEALFLSDRVVVLSRRPGRVIAELPVGIDRPRPRRETVTDPAFVELKERALEALSC